jgi:hypothetical protein
MCNGARLPTTICVMVPLRLQGKKPSKNTDGKCIQQSFTQNTLIHIPYKYWFVYVASTNKNV